LRFALRVRREKNDHSLGDITHLSALVKAKGGERGSAEQGPACDEVAVNRALTRTRSRAHAKVTVTSPRASWFELAKEAWDFVTTGGR
jgi:hypothetical protein